MKRYLLTLFALIANANSFAQTQTDAYYKTHAVWVQMMDTPSVNYYEALKAFDLFWLDKKRPIEENELLGADEEARDSKDFIVSKKNTEADAITYAFEYKKFLNWKEKVKSFVKEDGSIMTAEERIEQWKKQLAGRK